MLNKWTHIFFNKNGGVINLYINGKLQKEDSNIVINNLILDVKGIVIGQDQDSILGGFSSSQAVKGELDDLRIYDGTMSEGRIEKIYKLGK